MSQTTIDVGAPSETSLIAVAAPIAAFFGVVALCLRATLLDIAPTNRKDAVPPRRAKQQRQPPRVLLALLLILAAFSSVFVLYNVGFFTITQYRQFQQSVQAADSESDAVEAAVDATFRTFFAHTNLLTNAFREQLSATAGERMWFVSLFMLASTIVLLVFVESHRCCLRGGPSMLLGCLAAVCISVPLFLCGVATTSNETYWSRFIVPGRHVVGVAVSVTVACVAMLFFADAAHVGIILGVQVIAAVGCAFVGQVYFHQHPTVVAQTAALRSRLMMLDDQRRGAANVTKRGGGTRISSTQFIVNVERLVIDQSWISLLYAALAGASGLLFAFLAFDTARDEHFALWPTLRSVFGVWHAGPAAQSVVFDELGVMAALVVVAAYDVNTPRGWLALAAVASIVSPSIGVPMYLFARERALQNRYFLALSWALVDQDNHRGHGHGGEWSEPPLTRLANDDDIIAAAEPPRLY